jgi:hypothetical protein
MMESILSLAVADSIIMLQGRSIDKACWVNLGVPTTRMVPKMFRENIFGSLR